MPTPARIPPGISVRQSYSKTWTTNERCECRHKEHYCHRTTQFVTILHAEILLKSNDRLMAAAATAVNCSQRCVSSDGQFMVFNQHSCVSICILNSFSTNQSRSSDKIFHSMTCLLMRNFTWNRPCQNDIDNNNNNCSRVGSGWRPWNNPYCVYCYRLQNPRSLGLISKHRLLVTAGSLQQCPYTPTPKLYKAFSRMTNFGKNIK